jgi:hypothetical protein
MANQQVRRNRNRRHTGSWSREFTCCRCQATCSSKASLCIHVCPEQDALRARRVASLPQVETRNRRARELNRPPRKVITHPEIEDTVADSVAQSCPICFENKKVLVGLCGHSLCCGCSKHLSSRKDSAKCPICRDAWEDLRRIY